MTEEQWIDKVTLKKRWGIKEEGLIDLVSKRIITPYAKVRDGKFYPLPPKKMVTSYEQRENPESLYPGCTPILRTHTEYYDYTREEISNLLERGCNWFRQSDVENAEYEGKINLPQKPEDEPAPPQPDAKTNPVNYASLRRKQGAKNCIIALEMEQAGVNQLDIGRTLTKQEGVTVTVAAYKMRAQRLIKKGRESTKNENVTK